MKHYPKVYEDAFTNNDSISEKTSSITGSSDELAIRFRELMLKSNKETFDTIIKFIWLELQFVYNNRRRKAHSSNWIVDDRAFSQFMRRDVGTGHKTLTSNLTFTIVTTYIKDLFPNFLEHDPFLEPEYFEFPYKNISLEHLAFVYKMYDRIEMLDFAEERAMKYLEFSNWAVNQAFCYNEEVGETVYTLTSAGYHWAHINNLKIKKQWHKNNLNFEKYE